VCVLSVCAVTTLLRNANARVYGRSRSSGLHLLLRLQTPCYFEATSKRLASNLETRAAKSYLPVPPPTCSRNQRVLQTLDKPPCTSGQAPDPNDRVANQLPWACEPAQAWQSTAPLSSTFHKTSCPHLPPPHMGH
jgi:hypothetical protein